MMKPKGVPSGKPSVKSDGETSKPSGLSATKIGSESIAALDSSAADVIPVEVEQQQGGGRFNMRAFLGATADDAGAPEVAPKRGRGRPPKNPPQTIKLAPRDMVEMLLVPGMIFVSKLRLPEAAKPVREELESFLLPLCSIILRHTPPIAASADVLDIVRMAFAGMHYYQRVSPILAAQSKATSTPESQEVEVHDETETESSERSNGRLHLAPELAPARTGLYTGSA